MGTPITYYGGKQQLCRVIVGMMPRHRIYCEPFFGGGAVFFAKGKSYLEVINDKNDNLITFYKVCSDHDGFLQLAERIHKTLHSESEYKKALTIFNRKKKRISEIDIAWATWVQTNMSFCGAPGGGWKWDNGSAGSHSAIQTNYNRNTFSEQIHRRLCETQISCREALDVIIQRDGEDTFFYLDPPYPNTHQKHYSGYRLDDFEKLLKILSNIKGKFILSNYPSNILSEYIQRNGWYVQTEIKSMPMSNLNGKGHRKEELLVYNYPIEPTLF